MVSSAAETRVWADDPSPECSVLFVRADASARRRRVAVGSGGCVRAALADLETWLDVKGGGLL